MWQKLIVSLFKLREIKESKDNHVKDLTKDQDKRPEYEILAEDGWVQAKHNDLKENESKGCVLHHILT